MTKSSSKQKQSVNTITKVYLEEKLPYSAKHIFQTPTDEYKDTDYFVQVLLCTPKEGSEDMSPFILKSTNDRSKIEKEWKIISFLKENVKNPSRYISETQLMKVGPKIGLRMPILITFKKMMEIPSFPEKCKKYASQIIDL